MGKLHYAFVPIREKVTMPGLYKMKWDEMSHWGMDLPTLADELFGSMPVLAGDNLMDAIARAAFERRIFAFEGQLCRVGDYYYSIITRNLSKCKVCKCYHARGAGCGPIFKGSKS